MPPPKTRLRSPSPSEAAAKSGASGAFMRSSKMAGMDEIGVGMPTTEILQRHAVDDGAASAPSRFSKISCAYGARYSMHGIKYHGETAGKQRPDGREIEQLFHQRGIVGDGVDHLDDHARCGLEAAGPVEVDRSQIGDSVAIDFQAALVETRGQLSGAGPPLAALNLMPKSPSGPPGLWLADSTSPPMAPRLRMRLEAAGVDRMPPWPTTTFAKNRWRPPCGWRSGSPRD